MKLGEKATLKSALQRILNEIIAIQELLRNLKERVIEKIFATVPVQAYNASQQHTQAVHQKPGNRMTTGNLANGNTCEPGRVPPRCSLMVAADAGPDALSHILAEAIPCNLPPTVWHRDYRDYYEDDRNAMQGQKSPPGDLRSPEGTKYMMLIQEAVRSPSSPL